MQGKIIESVRGSQINWLANLRLKLIIGGVVLLLVAGAVTYAYIAGSSSRISDLERNAIQMQNNITNQQTIIEQQQKDMDLINRLADRINQGFRDADAGLAQLRRRLDQQNLREASHREPTETELLLNQDVAFTNRCNEIVTGAPVTDEDSSNTVCPDLIRRARSE